MPRRLAALALICLLGPSCTLLNKTVLHEFNYEPAVFHEVSRGPVGLELRFEKGEVLVVERWDCIDAATQKGIEVEERKPEDWVLGVAGVLGGSATAGAISLLGGAVVNSAIQSNRSGQPTAESQVVSTAIGIVGALAQLFAYKKIAEGLNEIRFRRERPVTQELGRKEPCDETPTPGTLVGPGLPIEGLRLNPSASPPPNFTVSKGALFSLDGRPVRVPPDVAERLRVAALAAEQKQ